MKKYYTTCIQTSNGRRIERPLHISLLNSSQKASRCATRRQINSANGSIVAYASLGSKNQWSVPAILLFTKNADYENEKCLKIKVFICILPAKEKKGHLFLTSTRRYGNLTKAPPFLIKGGTFLGFVFDIK